MTWKEVGRLQLQCECCSDDSFSGCLSDQQSNTIWKALCYFYPLSYHKLIVWFIHWSLDWSVLVSPSRRYSVLGRVLALQDRDQWTSPPSFFFVAVSRARRYSQKQRRFDGRSPGSLAGSASASDVKNTSKQHASRILEFVRRCRSSKGFCCWHHRWRRQKQSEPCDFPKQFLFCSISLIMSDRIFCFVFICFSYLPVKHNASKWQNCWTIKESV